MKIGDLIRNTRPSLGIPTGTVGLITNKHKSEGPHVQGSDRSGYYIYEIQWFGRRMSHSRRLERDLELV